MQLSKRFKLVAVALLAFVMLTAASVLTANAITVDFANERVTGIPAGSTMQFGTNGVAIPVSGTINIYPGTAGDVIITPPTGSPVTVGIPATRPTAPTGDQLPAAGALVLTTGVLPLPAGTEARVVVGTTFNAASQWQSGSINLMALATAPGFAEGAPGVTARNNAVQFRRAATSSTFAGSPVSATNVFTAGMFPEMPGAAAGVHCGTAADTLTGITALHEWAVMRGGILSDWTPGTGDPVPRSDFGRAAGIVHVRVAGTNTNLPSPVRIQTAPFPAMGTTGPRVNMDPDALPAEAGIYIDFANELLIGLTTEMQFRRAGTAAWQVVTTAIETSGLPLGPFIPAATAAGNIIIEVRYISLQGVTPSDISEVLIPRRPATPVAGTVAAPVHRFNGLLNNGEGGISAEEGLSLVYRVGGIGDWNDVVGDFIEVDNTVITAMTYNIRVSYNVSQTVAAGAVPTPNPRGLSVGFNLGNFSSAVLNVAVPAMAAAPNPGFNIVTDMVTGMTANRTQISVLTDENDDEWSNWTTVTAATLSRSFIVTGAEVITVQADGEDVAQQLVRFRNVATATTRPSQFREVAFGDPRDDAAPLLTLNFQTEMLTHRLYVATPAVPESVPGANDGTPFSDTAHNTALEWRRSTATAWTAVPRGGINLATVVPAPTATAPVIIYVRYRASAVLGGNFGPPSEAARIVLNPRPAAPAATAVTFDGTGQNGDGVLNFIIPAGGAFEVRARLAHYHPNPPTAAIDNTFPAFWTAAAATRWSGVVLNDTPPANLANATNPDAWTHVANQPGWSRVTVPTLRVPVLSGAGTNLAIPFEVRVAATPFTAPGATAVNNFEGTFGSPVRAITVPARPAAQRLGYSSAQDTITGVSAASEFSIGGEVWWRQPAGSTLTVLARGALNTAMTGGTPPIDDTFVQTNAHAVSVRVAATAAARSGVVATEVMPSVTNAPGFVINWETETVNINSREYQFRRVGVGNPTAWTTPTVAQADAGFVSISGLIPTAAQGVTATLEIRRAPVTGTNAAPPSAPQVLFMPPRPATPTAAAGVRFVGNSPLSAHGEIITLPEPGDGRSWEFAVGSTAGVATAHGNAGNWFIVDDLLDGEAGFICLITQTDGSGDLVIPGRNPGATTGTAYIGEHAARVYRIRIAPLDGNGTVGTVGAPGSLPFNVSVAARPNAPGAGVRFDTALSRVVGLTAAMEIQWNSADDTATGDEDVDGAWTRITIGVTQVEHPIISPEGTLFVRTAATATARASRARAVITPNFVVPLGTSIQLPPGFLEAFLADLEHNANLNNEDFVPPALPVPAAPAAPEVPVVPVVPEVPYVPATPSAPVVDIPDDYDYAGFPAA